MPSKNAYRWDDVDECLLCRSTVHRVFHRQSVQGFQIVNVVCDTCGLVFQTPRMDDASLEVYYRSDYLRTHQAAEGVPLEEIETQDLRAKHHTGVLKEYTAQIGGHLDIGSSTGRLLERVAESFGSIPVAVEPAEVYRAYTTQIGIQTWPKLSSIEGPARTRYDLVSLSHVLEHLPNPRVFLQEIREAWVSQRGLLLVETPNLYFHHSFEIPHLASYSAATLRAMLEVCGFRVLMMKAHGLPRTRTFPLYLLALAQPGSPPADMRWPSSGGLRVKRFFGRAAYLTAAHLLRLFRHGR